MKKGRTLLFLALFSLLIMISYVSAMPWINSSSRSRIGKDKFDPRDAPPENSIYIISSGLPPNFYEVNVSVTLDRVWNDGDAIIDVTPDGPNKFFSNASGDTYSTSSVWRGLKRNDSGFYDVVVDVDGDGRFNKSVDAVDGMTDPGLEIVQFNYTESNYSIDAATVFSSSGGIYFSFYGHNPKIPKPVDNITDWKWWTPEGDSVQIISSDSRGGDSSISFDRSTGKPAVVWVSNNKEILYSEWNGSEWTNPEVVYSSAIEENFDRNPVPVIIIDVSGTVLVAWLEIIESGTNARILSKYRQGGVWGPLEVVQNLQGEGYALSYTSIDMAFSSKIVNGITRHDAYLGYYYLSGSFDVICSGQVISFPHYKAFYSYWNGTGWSEGKEIDGQPDPPPTYNIDIRDRMGISSDKFGNVTAVWGIKEKTDPCSLNSVSKIWTSTKQVDNPSWINTQSLAEGYNPSISFTEDDIGIAIYSGGALKMINGTWKESNIPGLCVGKSASLHKDKIMTVGSSSSGVCSVAMNSKNFTLEQPFIIGPGGGLDIEANTGSPSNPHAEWTFMEYNDADDGDGIGLGVEANRLEAKQIGSTNLINVIFQTDRPRTNPSTRIFYEKKGDEKVIKDYNISVNMGNDTTLSDFVAYSIENYPAKRYWLTLDNHGGGYKGICWDFTSGRDQLTMPELRKAYSDINKKFNIISYDACYMAMLEDLYQGKEFANYFTASENVVPNAGYNYVDLIGNLISYPFESDEFHANKTVESYSMQYATVGATLAAIKGSEIKNLADKTNDFANVILDNLENETFRKSVINARDNAQRYDGSIGSITRDLYDFTRLVKENTTIPAVDTAANNLMTQINKTVVKEWHSLFPGSHGISIYFQHIRLEILNDLLYSDTLFAKETNWSNLILNISGSSFIKLQLSGTPHAFLNVIDSNGNSAGGIDISMSKCGGFCTVTIPEAQCSDEAKKIIIPITNFTWYVNGSLLENTTNFNLTIQVIENDTLIQQQLISGTISSNETISGTFPSSTQLHPNPPLSEPSPVNKNRFISLIPGNPGKQTALRVKLTSLHHPAPPYTGGNTTNFSAYEGQYRWVQAPQTFVESNANPTTFKASQLGCTPYYTDWSNISLLNIYGAEIVPSSLYGVQAIEIGCGINSPTCYSSSLIINTSRWGDVVEPFNPPIMGQPTFADISAIVNKFKNTQGAISKVRAKLSNVIVNLNTDVSFADISVDVDAFKGKGYPYSINTNCGTIQSKTTLSTTSVAKQ